MKISEDKLLELVSELIHDEWVEWAKQIEHEVAEDRKNRWNTVYIPYDDLSEDMKEKDRNYGRKVISMLKENKII
jgi:hypothetical protein